MGDRLLGAAGNQDVVGGHLQAGITPGLRCDGIPELREPGCGAVVMGTRVNTGPEGGIHGRWWGRKIGLSGRKRDDVCPRRPKLLGPTVHRQGRRFRDGRHLPGDCGVTADGWGQYTSS